MILLAQDHRKSTRNPMSQEGLGIQTPRTKAGLKVVRTRAPVKLAEYGFEALYFAFGDEE